MINSIQQTPTISQHKRSLNSTSSSKPSVSMTACVNKNEIKREPAEINFCGFFKPETFDRLYTNQKFHKVLQFAKDKQIVFSAGFVLFLTCVLRPAAIVLLPSKKNKEDQKYASAHSIASGVIGYALSSVILAPLTNGITRLTNDPKLFVKPGHMLLSNDKVAKATTGTLINRAFTDILPAIPKGILTIALIPPILKYVFGVEKKKHAAPKAEAATSIDYSLLNFKSGNKAAVNGGIR